MAKLWAFGDSYTAGIAPDAFHYTPYIEYLEYLGLTHDNLPKEWVELLAEKLGYEFEIIAIGGASNDETFHNFAKNSHRYQENDIVIINWSQMQRFRWGDGETLDEENWRRFSAHMEFGDVSRSLGSDDFFRNVGLNRLKPVWRNEIYYYENLIKSFSKSLGFHVFFWDMDGLLINTLPLNEINKKEYLLNEYIIEYFSNKNEDPEKIVRTYVGNILWDILQDFGIKSINKETNGVCRDIWHLGFDSHVILSELFYNYIKKSIDIKE